MNKMLSELIQKHNVRPMGVAHVGLQQQPDLDCYAEHCISKVIWFETGRAFDSFYRANKSPLTRYNFLNVDIENPKFLAQKGARNSLRNFDHIFFKQEDSQLGECLERQGFKRVELNTKGQKNSVAALYARKKFH